jgi:sugar lactone lactonase YvrE
MPKSLPLLAITLASTIPISGCAGAISSMSPNAPSAAAPSATTAAPGTARNRVYVSDQLQKAVLAFPASERAQNPAPAQTIDFGVITEGVWVDRHGILYVALFAQTPSQVGKVEEFKPGASSPFRTITDGISEPQNLIVDAQGTLYVDQTFGFAVQVVEYPAGQTSPSTTLQITDKGEPVAGGMTLDAHGNLYVHAFFVDDAPSRVYEFPHGQTRARDLQLSGLGDTSGLTGDAKGNLYVSDSAAGISVYAPGQKNPMRQIAPPPNDYFDGFVATRSGKLYVAQGEGGLSQASLLEYAAGGSQPVNVLSGYLQGPLMPALRAAAL